MRDADRRAALKLPRELIGAELNQRSHLFQRCSDWRAKSMTSFAYLFQVEHGFDGSFGGCQHAQMGGVDRSRPNVRVTRHSLHYSIKIISYSIGGAADVTHTHMGGARYHFHRLQKRRVGHKAPRHEFNERRIRNSQRLKREGGDWAFLHFLDKKN